MADKLRPINLPKIFSTIMLREFEKRIWRGLKEKS